MRGETFRTGFEASCILFFFCRTVFIAPEETEEIMDLGSIFFKLS